jgi:hypothetical protein
MREKREGRETIFLEEINTVPTNLGLLRREVRTGKRLNRRDIASGHAHACLGLGRRVR